MPVTNSGGDRPQKAKAPRQTNRLPSSRERRPALAALAVLLIAGGAVLAGWLALRQGQTTSYLAIRDQVWAGEKIARSDLGAVDFPSDTKAALIPTTQVEEVVGSYALTDLPEGNVLTENQIGDSPKLPGNSSRIGLSLEPGQVPMELHVGQEVNIVVLDPSGETNKAVGTAVAVVTAVSPADSDTGGRVDVLVSKQCQDTLTAAAAQGDVSLSALPQSAGTTTLVCSTSIKDPHQKLVASHNKKKAASDGQSTDDGKTESEKETESTDAGSEDAESGDAGSQGQSEESGGSTSESQSDGNKQSGTTNNDHKK